MTARDYKISHILIMKVNTSVQFKDVLKNFPKAYSNAELCKHFASEYRKIVKRVERVLYFPVDFRSFELKKGLKSLVTRIKLLSIAFSVEKGKFEVIC